jgi:predicted lipoprotein with Yx(FWY)xxD motif
VNGATDRRAEADRKGVTMRNTVSGTLAAGLFALTLSAALGQPAPAKTGDTAKGKALVDGAGMTLYWYDRDSAGTSNCTGVCANNWPPFHAPADAKPLGEWTVVARKDGGKQWAYKGKPLYTFYNDGDPGDVKGDGVNNVWHIAAP